MSLSLTAVIANGIYSKQRQARAAAVDLKWPVVARNTLSCSCETIVAAICIWMRIDILGFVDT